MFDLQLCRSQRHPEWKHVRPIGELPETAALQAVPGNRRRKCSSRCGARMACSRSAQIRVSVPCINPASLKRTRRLAAGCFLKAASTSGEVSEARRQTRNCLPTVRHGESLAFQINAPPAHNGIGGVGTRPNHFAALKTGIRRATVEQDTPLAAHVTVGAAALPNQAAVFCRRSTPSRTGQSQHPSRRFPIPAPSRFRRGNPADLSDP